MELKMEFCSNRSILDRYRDKTIICPDLDKGIVKPGEKICLIVPGGPGLRIEVKKIEEIDDTITIHTKSAVFIFGIL